MSRVVELRALVANVSGSLTVDVEREQADLGNGELVDYFTVDIGDADGMSVLYAQSEEDPSDLAALIAAAPEALTLLLNVAEAGQALEDAENAGDIEAVADAMDALGAALARLEDTP